MRTQLTGVKHNDDTGESKAKYNKQRIPDSFKIKQEA